MILQTPILALLLVAALASAVALWSGWFALRVLRQWDIASGTRAQLRLERSTQLVSTLFGFVMLAEIAALLLFVFNADRMAALFVGAMCAVGTLNVNAYGFPALYLKIAVFFAAAAWLMLDRADRAGRDYPLTKVKYAALLAIVPLILASAGTELAYFLGLETDVITSCCSKLFTPVNEGIAAEMTGLAPGAALWLLAGAGFAVAATGGLSLATGRGHGWFALGGAVFFAAALAAIVSVISLYIYDHPNHHCPFCILKPEFNYFGYALYIPLFSGTALALGAGLVSAFGRAESLAPVLPAMLRRQVTGALIAFALFGLAVIWAIARSQLILFG
ncbi:hypothetical protein [Sinisalibacter aestuarii]|uniref:Uncharacterized protein n=1 Tax=Sinisalibacter aestuarii TaxID=2949426 RepID=A0ABQ5LX44_9RHOB|nr:hypothetical protein [Sinisalibacter aestuarii]GKY89551.1 hypothetical protein STA1M1_34200 [Sinisalibacter aestuarii]